MSDDGELFEGVEGAEGKRPRRRARHRGSVEVLPSGAVRVRIRDVRLPDGRTVALQRTITADFGRTVADRVKEAKSRVLPAMVRQALDLESGLAAFDSSMTLAECVQRLRADKTQPFAWRRVDDTLWKRCRPMWGLPLASIDVPRMRAQVERWTNDGHSAAYVRTLGGLVRRILGRAAERRWLARPPVWPMGLLPSKTIARRGMSAKLLPEEKQAVFAAAEARDREKGTDLATRLAFQLDLGLRPVECAWARVHDLREEPAGSWWFYPNRAKGSGLRVDEGIDRLPVSVALAERILRRLDGLPARARATGWLFPVAGRGSSWGPRFVETGGSRRADTWVTEAEIGDIRARSGVSFYAYQLRHTRAHELLTAGVSSAELQRFGAWRTPEIVHGYAGMVRELPAAFSAPSAPTPAPGKLRGVTGGKKSSSSCSEKTHKGIEVPCGFTSGVNLPETLGHDAAPANGAPIGPGVNPLGASVGAGGRGRAVGGDAPPTASAELLSWLEEVDEWKTARAAVSAWARRLGLAEIRRRAAVVSAVESSGSVSGREGSVRALAVALGSRLAERGPKKAPAVTEKVNNLRAMGGAGDYPPK